MFLYLVVFLLQQAFPFEDESGTYSQHFLFPGLKNVVKKVIKIVYIYIQHMLSLVNKHQQSMNSICCFTLMC